MVRPRQHVPRLARRTGALGQRRACLRPVPAEARGEGYEPWALQVVEIENGRIAELTFFLDVETVFPRFGLPLEYAGA